MQLWNSMLYKYLHKEGCGSLSLGHFVPSSTNPELRAAKNRIHYPRFLWVAIGIIPTITKHLQVQHGLINRAYWFEPFYLGQ